MGAQPRGPQLGTPGPDQGYLFSLFPRFEGTLRLREGEHERDALVGAAQVALKRASLFGRAPVLHDLTAALTIWGFLDDAPDELAELRKPLFEEAANPYHYDKQRRIADLVPPEVLRQSHTAMAAAHQSDWRSLLAADAIA